jgi:hypothetical protein
MDLLADSQLKTVTSRRLHDNLLFNQHLFDRFIKHLLDLTRLLHVTLMYLGL